MIDFPNSPTVDQVVTGPNGRKWKWDGTAWVLVGSAGGGGGGGSSGFTYAQEAVPVGMGHGATWHDTSTGISYVYVADANSNQWVQFAPGLGELPKTPADYWIHFTFSNGTTLASGTATLPGLVYRTGKGLTMDTTKVTITRSGFYQITGCVTVVNGSGSTFLTLQAVANGTVPLGQAVGNASGTGQFTYANLNMEFCCELGEGTTLRWEVSTSGTGVTIDGRMGITVRALTLL